MATKIDRRVRSGAPFSQAAEQKRHRRDRNATEETEVKDAFQYLESGRPCCLGTPHCPRAVIERANCLCVSYKSNDLIA